MNVYIHTCMQIPFLPYIRIKFFSAWKVYLCKLKLQIIMRISPLGYVLLFVKEQGLTVAGPSCHCLRIISFVPTSAAELTTCSYHSWVYVCMASNKLNWRLSVITEQPTQTCRTQTGSIYFVQIPFNNF